MTLVISPADDGATALWIESLESPTVEALLNICGRHLDYPQILGASRIVSCEVRMLCLSKPCEMLVKLF